MTLRTTDVTEQFWIFKRADGAFLRVERCGSQNRAMWAEWTADAFDASRFGSKSGLSGDHRWPEMAKDCEPIECSMRAIRTVEIPA